MKSLHDANACNDNWGVLLLDASDTLNECNVQMMTWAVRHLWPTGSRFVFNLHRHHSKTIMHGATAKRSFFLDCREGVSQGCPMSMTLYGLLLSPFITKLKQLFPTLPPRGLPMMDLVAVN